MACDISGHRVVIAQFAPPVSIISNTVVEVAEPLSKATPLADEKPAVCNVASSAGNRANQLRQLAMSAPKSDKNQNLEMRDDPEVTVMDISRIHSYERNPRRSDNPEYDRIKSSIRNNGLDQPLVITRRPEATDYIVRAGGNTRLRILKELYAETSDPCFARVPCVLTPWRCESEVLVAHLRENDLRGSLTFIDKAQAVFEARQFIEQELGVEDITNKDLAVQLRATGYSIGESLISHMGYGESIFQVSPIKILLLTHGKYMVKKMMLKV